MALREQREVESPVKRPLWRLHGWGSLLGVYGLIAIVGLLVLLPIGYLVFGALWSVPPRVAGGYLTMANVAKTLGAAGFSRGLVTSIGLGLSAGMASTVLGTVLAWLVARTDLPGRATWRRLLSLPLYVSPLLLAIAWVTLAAPNSGFINILARRGILNIYSFGGIWWVLTSNLTSYAVLSMLAPVEAMDPSLEEASLVTGAGRWLTTWRITLRMMFPAMLATGIMVVTLAIENFAAPVILGGPARLSTIPTEIYFALSYAPPNPSGAAVMSIPLMLVAILGAVSYSFVSRMSSRYVTVTGKPSMAQPIPLGRWKLVGVLVPTFYFLASFIVPMIGLLFGSLVPFVSNDFSLTKLTFRNYVRLGQPQYLLPIRNTLLLGIVGATVITILGFVVAYVVQKSKTSGRSTLDYLLASSAAFPGTVLGVGMMWAYVSTPLYGTLGILLVAYLTRYLAYGARVSGSALLQLGGELEEAAQVLGASTWRRIVTVVIPLVRRGVLSAWIVLFVFVVNEISATVLLYSPQSITLGVSIWLSQQMNSTTVVFAMGVIQTLIIMVAMGAVQRLGDVRGYVAGD